MSISPAGVFRYTAALRRGQSGAWVGRAEASDPARHPGLAGDQPEMTIPSGVLTLRRTGVEPVLDRTMRELPGGRRVSALLHGLRQTLHRTPTPSASLYDRWGPPASTVTIHVGDLIEAVVEDGDVLTVFRADTGDLGLVLRRGDAILLGIGAVSAGDFDDSGDINLDPRVKDQEWYDLPSRLAREDTALIWLNADNEDPARARRAVEWQPAANLVVVITGKGREARARSVESCDRLGAAYRGTTVLSVCRC